VDTFVQDRLKRLSENYTVIHQAYRLQVLTQKRLSAFYFAQKDLPVPIDKIRQAEAEIKKTEGVLSPMRGLAFLPLAATLAMEDNALLLPRTKTLYQELRTHFMRSDYLLLAALELAKQADTKNMDETIERMQTLYRTLRGGRLLRVGADDIILIARLALMDEPTDTLIKQVNLCYDALRTALPGGGTLIGVAQYLVMCGNASASLLKVSELARRFTEYGFRMTSRNYIRVLALLAHTEKGSHTLVGETVSFYNALKKERGFSGWYAWRYEVLLYIAACIASEGLPEEIVEAQNAYVTAVATNIAIAAAASA
jgi:hypothetical protein